MDYFWLGERSMPSAWQLHGSAHHTKAAMDTPKRQPDFVLTIHYLQTLEFKFHIIFLVSCNTIALLLLLKKFTNIETS